jgi:hypothetical protein
VIVSPPAIRPLGDPGLHLSGAIFSISFAYPGVALRGALRVFVV